MQSIKHPYIISISRNSRSDTTQSQSLLQEFNETTVVLDNFDDICTGPNNYVGWSKRGGK